MKLDELLKNVKPAIREWGVFVIAAILLSVAIFNGVVYKNPIIDKGEASDISTDLSPYVKFFEDNAALYNVKLDMKNLVVKFVEVFPVKSWIGLCEQGIGVSKYVSVQRKYFENAAAEVKYSLMVHELGHCVLNKRHVEGYRANNCPKSVMHPSDALFGCFFKDQDYYFRELFNLL